MQLPLFVEKYINTSLDIIYKSINISGGKNMKNNKILKGAGVLLIVAALIFSSVAIANTKTNQPNLNTTHDGSGQGARGDIVWDNGMDYEGLLAAQEPSSPANLDAYPADDFIFDEDTEVCDVHWIGGYWNGDPQEWDWCILFYYDRGDGAAPGNPYIGKFCYTWGEINKEELEPGYWEMWVDLPENYLFPADEKFWISIWAVGDHMPQSGWGYHQDPIKLHQAVLKSIWFGVPDWTDTSELLGYAVDMCFQLTTKQTAVPDLDCDGALNWVDVKPGDTVTGDFVVMNIGDPGSLLNWEITDWPAWGNWTFTPLSGTGLKPGDGPFTVQVEVVAPEEQNQEFNGTVKIVNKDDTTDTCTISVSLATPISHQVNNFPLLQRILELFPNAFPILRNLLGM